LVQYHQIRANNYFTKTGLSCVFVSASFLSKSFTSLDVIIKIKNKNCVGLHIKITQKKIKTPKKFSVDGCLFG